MGNSHIGCACIAKRGAGCKRVFVLGVVLLESGLTKAPRHAKIGAAMLAQLAR